MGTRGIFWSIAFVAVIALLRNNAPVITAATIQPTVDGIVRDGPDCFPSGAKDGIPDCTLEGSIVQVLNVPRFEDRGIVEFSLSGLSQPIFNAQLVLPVFGSNGPFPFTVYVFGYAGDGALTLSDWAQGSFLASFSYSGEQAVTLDVTSFISSAAAAGDAFAGFNFQFAMPSSIEVNGPFVAFGSLEIPPAAYLRVSEPQAAAVAIDIKPQSCPNPLNVRARGVLPVAILGTSTFDVTQVNVATVKLEGVSPLRSAPEDVATPFVPSMGKTGPSDCTAVGSDGFLDLTLKFDNQAVVAALGTVTDGQVLVFQMTGNLKPQFGGTPILGEDVVVILKQK